MFVQLDSCMNILRYNLTLTGSSGVSKQHSVRANECSAFMCTTMLQIGDLLDNNYTVSIESGFTVDVNNQIITDFDETIGTKSV